MKEKIQKQSARTAVMDVIRWGDRKLLVQLWSVPDIPKQIGFGRYFEGSCEIALGNGEIIYPACLASRPRDRRNVVGDRIIDWLTLVIETDLTSEQLSGAKISIRQDYVEVSEDEARSRWGRD